MNTESIQNLIIQSEKNLSIADAVAEAFPEVRRELVEVFLSRLEARLKAKHKGWSFHVDQDFFDAQYSWFRFWKPSWKNRYGVGFTLQNYGRTTGFGVYSEKEKKAKRPYCKELLNAIKKSYSWVHETPYCAAFVEMKSPAADWRKADILWKMHTKTEFLDDVAGQLLDFVQMSERILDRFAQKKDAAHHEQKSDSGNCILAWHRVSGESNRTPQSIPIVCRTAF